MEVLGQVVTPLRMLETVLCLECGESYAKPAAGGTVEKNPGCPECGYVGWIPLTRPIEPRSQPRFAEDLQQHRLARLR
jgi:hypothetical protein